MNDADAVVGNIPPETEIVACSGYSTVHIASADCQYVERLEDERAMKKPADTRHPDERLCSYCYRRYLYETDAL